MKKFFPVFLLVIFLFNVGGYYIVFWGLKVHSQRTLTASVDAGEYDETELIELKIPVSLPYPVDESNFRRATGNFEHNGEYYHLVKQRFENDTLYILCLKDMQRKKLFNSFRDYVKIANDLPPSSKKTLNLLSKLIKDFQRTPFDNTVHHAGWTAGISFGPYHYVIIASVKDTPSPPPKA